MDQGPLRTAIIDAEAFAAALEASAAAGDADTREGRAGVIDLAKSVLVGGNQEIKHRFENGTKGLEAANLRSFLIDEYLRVLFHFTTHHLYRATNPTDAERLAIVAVGGYGRGQLAPYSDVDLLFLSPYKQTSWGEQVVEYLYYMLWDTGLKVGHATRSLDESVHFAKKDITIRTALLESRFVAGDRALFKTLRRRFSRDVVAGSGPDFVEAKLQERDERHRQKGDSRYVVEPNVKEGKGGLRDLHTLYWIGKYLYRVDQVSELVSRGVLTRREYHRFAKASDFLWTVRHQLHYLTDRAEERLTFDVQPEIGRLLGYRDHRGARGVERFMKHYYLIAKTVGDLTRIFCAALEEQHRRKPLLRRLTFGFGNRDIEGFVEQGGRLNLQSEDDFAADPVRLIRLFHVADREGFDIHPAVLRQITRNLVHINRRLRANKEANRLFLEVLTSRNDPETALRRMSEAGVLGRFVQDFGRVVAQMQYDMYHVYTVDEHAIRAIGILSRIERGELTEEFPLASELIHNITSRRALYLALFLHDIAKGRGGDHSEIGEAIARKLGPRLGMTPEEVETASWLVRFHLSMSHTAFKRDLQDPKTVADFVELVQSPERLRLLLILTVADIRAVGPGRWNAWNGQLLRELYRLSEEAMLGGSSPQSERVGIAQAKVRSILRNWTDDAFAEHALRFAAPYWLAAEPEVIARNARLMRKADRRKNPYAFDARADDANVVTEITLYSKDEPGLFARIAAAMAHSGVGIVDAKIMTTTDGMALDTFNIQDRDGRAVTTKDQLDKLGETIEATLRRELDLDKSLSRKTRLPSRTSVFKVVPRVLIDNQASYLYTVVEINARDRPRLLYDVTRALAELELSTTSAHIQTFGERAVDVFYVKDKFGLKIENERQLERISARITEALKAAEHKPTDRTKTSAKTKLKRGPATVSRKRKAADTTKSDAKKIASGRKPAAGKAEKSVAQ